MFTAAVTQRNLCYKTDLKEHESNWGLESKVRFDIRQLVIHGLDSRGIGVRFPAGEEIFYFCTAYRPAPGLTEPPI